MVYAKQILFFVEGPVEFFYLDSNMDRMSESTIQRQLRIMLN